MIGRVVTAGIAAILSLDFSLAADPELQPALPNNLYGCEDSIIGVAADGSELDCNLFKTTITSYRFGMLEDRDGGVENTFGGQITAEDLMRIEHTADCISSHQGDHLMEFCDAVATKDRVMMNITGGLPAYASHLTITINKKLEFKCFFSAVYPAPNVAVHWKVTKKALKLKATDFNAGKRLRGWISVEFDEIDKITKETHAYKIEGFFKPVIQTPQEEDQSKEGEQADPAKAETKPADKAPAKEQSTPVTK